MLLSSNQKVKGQANVFSMILKKSKCARRRGRVIQEGAIAITAWKREITGEDFYFRSQDKRTFTQNGLKDPARGSLASTRVKTKTNSRAAIGANFKGMHLSAQAYCKVAVFLSRNNHEVKSKEELFYYLHNTSKIKEVKMAQLNQPSALSQTKSKKDFSDFLKRNEEYASIVRKKQEILKDNAEKYDLKTGSKLFTPKITENKGFIYNSNSSAKYQTGKKSE
jgi:hypothetical protein